MIPLCIPDLAGNEARYLAECVETNFVSSVGPFVDRFEAAVAGAAGAPAAVAVSSGTTGLHVALTALGISRDDLVIMPTFTFIASANAIAHCGAAPWLLDIDAASWTLSPAVLRRALETETRRDGRRLVHAATGRRVAAILPVYTLGTPADVDPIVALAREFGLPVVADAAAALGATYKGRPIGTLGPDLTVFSFNGNKTVTAGGGGAVTGADQGLLAAVRHLSTTARIGTDYTHDRVGFNYRLTNLQAAVGLAQMERLDHLVGAKRRIRAAYDRAFAGLPGVGFFPASAWAAGSDWFSGIVIAAGKAAALRGALRGDGIDARPFWKPVHLQPPYSEAPTTLTGESEALWRRIVTLPCSTSLSEADQAAVIAAVRRALA